MSGKRVDTMAELDVLLNINPDFLKNQSPDVQAAIAETIEEHKKPGKKSTKVTDTESDVTLSQNKEQVQSEGSGGTGPVATVKETVEQQVVVPTQKVLRNTGSWLEGVNIPGGIALPLGILLLFTLALFPVNGHTRLGWLWLAVTGQAEIGGPLPTPIPNTGVSQAFGGGASGNFGNGTGPTGPTASSGAGGTLTISYGSLLSSSSSEE